MREFTKIKIYSSQSVKEALILMEKTKLGFLIAISDEDKVLGTITDGDLRRSLIKNDKKDNLEAVINKDFIFVRENFDREKVLKQFDRSIKFIPVLNDKDKLVTVLTPSNLPLESEKEVFYRAKSPVRISFAGGGSDLTKFFSSNGGAVINATISLFTHCTLTKNKDESISLFSQDLNKSFHADSLDNAEDISGEFNLIIAVLKTINPDFGFNLYLHSDYPINSGLGGSAVVASSILGCFNQTRQDKWTDLEIAELAFQAERILLDLPGGWQDQYATVIGGLNFMEFKSDENLIHPIRLKKDLLNELEANLVLCFTGIAHNSGHIHSKQKKELDKSDVTDRVIEAKNLTYEMRNNLLMGRFKDFGNSMHKAWQLKKSFSEDISSSHLNDIYDNAIKNGASGGKLLGAGGGGFFLFYAAAESRHKLLNYLKSRDLQVFPFTFQKDGLTAWTTRKN